MINIRAWTYYGHHQMHDKDVHVRTVPSGQQKQSKDPYLCGEQDGISAS